MVGQRIPAIRIIPQDRRELSRASRQKSPRRAQRPRRPDRTSARQGALQEPAAAIAAVRRPQRSGRWQQHRVAMRSEMWRLWVSTNPWRRDNSQEDRQEQASPKALNGHVGQNGLPFKPLHFPAHITDTTIILHNTAY